jgi:hypothetical protein
MIPSSNVIAQTLSIFSKLGIILAKIVFANSIDFVVLSSAAALMRRALNALDSTS